MKLNDFLIKWPLRIAVIVGGLGVIALYSYRAVSTPSIKTINISRSTNGLPLSVTRADAETLSPNILSSDSPAGSSENELSNSQGSGAALQSNLNVNDPSVSSSPLVQSLYSGGQ